MWIKANPNLHVSVDAAKLESTIQKARGIPSQWVEMLTKRFNIWCQGSTPWMGAGAWDACALDYTEEDLAGMECYAGFDLSSTSDITSVSYAFPFDREIRLLPVIICRKHSCLTSPTKPRHLPTVGKSGMDTHYPRRLHRL